MPIIQSVERALRILDLFNEYDIELKITDISTKMGLHKSTLHSLLKTMQMMGYIDQNSENGKYRLGMKLVERGNLLINSIDIREKARSYLLDLSSQTGQTTHLAILDGKEGVYIDKVEGKLAVITFSRIGRRLPIHATAIGKALLAFNSEQDINALLKDYVFTRQTPNTIIDRDAYLKELELVRQNGYALDNQENEQGVRCISVPIWNHSRQIIAAISMSTLTNRVTDAEINDYIVLLKAAAKALSQHLGYNDANG
ncbi:IclR family transcriptional regulator [Pectobacteriaceae bacterium CE90]|uniref:IclR family transcriptional regulator n=1 Tax=Brenneria uluponensis TaxID=3057057 RepID=UPI0025B4BE9B|nr:MULTISPECIES: IclR family transcriptional regulator [Pectobacteriaceae]WJV53263.1 IclR family transcriptional regulator [Prodigiosinella sp. LS101]WJV57625.1 IclR family transcriptional regulator [Pectobacteriaceae bacterium C111]WJY15728.1 IclR family transcriptional regulator [Pectobacteriaceae bacterium CE90]